MIEAVQRKKARSTRCNHASRMVGAACIAAIVPLAAARAQTIQQNLPDAPSTILLASAEPMQRTTNLPSTSTTTQTTGKSQAEPAAMPACPGYGFRRSVIYVPGKYHDYCEQQNPIQFIVDPGPVKPLTSNQKGLLAIKGVLDPFGLITLVGFSGISIAANSHSAYGPGVAGWGRLVGYGLVENVTGEFFGTYAIPSLVHEDPRYHRLPGKSVGRRLGHAIIHTYVSQHDDGSLMPNYATLLNYPINAGLANLYVPGTPTNASSTFDRILEGIATDPVGAIIAEFLPDVAKRVHVHIIFVQQIINRVANGPTNNSGI
jgi:hypothetical protein